MIGNPAVDHQDGRQDQRGRGRDYKIVGTTALMDHYSPVQIFQIGTQRGTYKGLQPMKWCQCAESVRRSERFLYDRSLDPFDRVFQDIINWAD